MSYRQFKYNNKEKNSFYEELKEKAIEKIKNAKNLLENEESEEEEEEEEESSESEFNSTENNSKKSMDSTKLIRAKQLSLEK